MKRNGNNTDSVEIREKERVNVMKYLILLGDGMADEPVGALGGKTPLEYAHTPVMDALAGMGEQGLVQTVPDGMIPASDVANLSVLGFDPVVNYTGRSPLEALSRGIPMTDTDTVLRCSLVTLSAEQPYAAKRMLDHSSGELTTAEADVLMDAIRAEFDGPEFRFYTGTGYRELTVCRHLPVPVLEAPHDHAGEVIGPVLPKEQVLREMMERSYEILKAHPLNLQRMAAGKNPANSVWFWGAGIRPHLENFREKTGLRGAMVSAVDLLKGIAVGSGMKVLQVPGANAGLDTDYEGKADAAVQALLEEGFDFVYLHVEAPDEMGHLGEPEKKAESIAYLDSRILARVKPKLDESGEDYRIMVLPDHPTPVALRHHTGNPVPYLIYDSRRQMRAVGRYSEREAAMTGNYFASAPELFLYFLEQESTKEQCAPGRLMP